MSQSIHKNRETYVTMLSEIYPKEEIEAIFRIALEHVMNRNYYTIVTNIEIDLSQKDIEALNSILLRLKNNEPIQHITGKAHFYDLEFIVNQNVLIPRQETELLVHEILKRCDKNESLKVLDIGTGSGCIAISLKKNFSKANVYAIDVSEEALKIAGKNAELNRAEINFRKVNILHPDLQLEKQFDIIVSNPPYVRMSEKEFMHKNVVNFDPELALYVEDLNPLLFYERIIRFAKNHLSPGGMLAFEINEAFGKELIGMLVKNQFSNPELIQDLDGKDRIILAEKP